MINLNTPETISKIALEHFHLGHSRLMELFVDEYLNNDKLYLKLSAPATKISFAIELMLKAMLLLKNSSFPKYHNIFKLYNLLPFEDQVSIILIYKQLNPLDFPTFRFSILENNPNNEDPKYFESPDQEILHNLKLHELSFNNWRYIAMFTVDLKESSSQEYNFSFMCNFFKALYQYLEHHRLN
jgi:hypothetical protein